MGSDTTLLSVRNIYILFYFLNIMKLDRIHYCLSGIFILKYNELGSDTTLLSVRNYLHFILFLKYNELGSDTTLLSVRNIYILFYFLNIMNWDRTLHYCLSGLFTFYFIS